MSDYRIDTDWPLVPVDREAVKVFAPRGNIALVLGQLKAGTEADAALVDVLAHLPATLPRQHLCAIGRVRTLKEGLERLVRNVIANPYIDTLILLGRDSKVFRPLRGLDCLLRHGVDEAGRICCPDQDDAVRRVFQRDSLVNLTPAEIAWFRERTGVRVIADLVDGPVDAGEAFAAAAELVARFGHEPREPDWSFLTELDVGSWRPPPPTEATEAYAERLERFALEFEPSGEEELRVRLSASARSQAPLGNASPRSSASHADTDSSIRIRSTGNPATRAEKVVHTVLRILRDSEIAPGDREAGEIGLAVETEDCHRDSDRRLPGERGSAGASPSRQATTGEDADAIDAELTPYADDPRGYFLITVEAGRVRVDIHRNRTEGNSSTARHVATVVGSDPRALLKVLLDRDDFGRHDLRLEHIAYIAQQLARAAAAIRLRRQFVQDKPLGPPSVEPNTTQLNAAVLIDADTLDSAWRQGLASLQRDGLITRTQKGEVVENWCTLFHIRNMGSLQIPPGYPSSEENISAYVNEFFEPRPADSTEYTYGDRMCHFYGYDQVADLVRRLRDGPDLAHPSQRYDPWTDLGKSHIPCLAFDVWFLHAGKLHTLQVPRSHDIYGAMPQNALGIARGWANRIAGELGVPLGDLVFLSTSNNYRKADNADAVATLVRSMESPPIVTSSGLVRVNHSRPQPGEVRDEPLQVVWRPEFREPTQAERARVGALLDGPLGERLLRHRGLDQVRRFAEHLNSARAKDPNYRTQYGLLSPRDPIADRGAVHRGLLSLQLRNQLGKLHAAAVFVNPLDDEADRTALVSVLLRMAAERTRLEAGSVFVLTAETRNPS